MTKRKTRVKCPTIIQQRRVGGARGLAPTFEFYRFRFHFEALDPVRFPPGFTANVIRGACGLLLRRLAPPEVYNRIFQPSAGADQGPSGFADRPRPFVFRAAHLDGCVILPGGLFTVDAHVFDLRRPVLPYFREAFAQLAIEGIGPERGRARLTRVEQLDLDDQPQPVQDQPASPCSVSLEPAPIPVEEVTVRFATVTELKSASQPVERPEFPILLARIRDRIATLRALYGGGALDLDFRGMGARAAAVVLTRCQLTWENSSRRSSRTGRHHPLGGFLGEAEYQGVLAEFLPWLRAARWTGVGRQTVWGKGDLRVLHARTSASGSL